MTTPMWRVVKFLGDSNSAEEESVETVPSSWLCNEDECFWPPFTSKKDLEKAIKSAWSPNPSWNRIKIISKECQQFKVASAKASKALFSSDIDSNTDKEESDEESQLIPNYPVPPNLNNKLHVGGSSKSGFLVSLHRNAEKHSQRRCIEETRFPCDTLASKNCPDVDCPSPSISSEFPEEENEGLLPMAVISTNWIFTKMGNLYCHWPTYFKSDLLKNRAIENHESLILDKCNGCPIVIKYTSSDYGKTIQKLKYLEDHSSVSSSDSDVDLKRQRKKKSFSDFDSHLSEDEYYVPRPPKFPKRNNSQIKNNITCNKEANVPVLPSSCPTVSFSDELQSTPSSSRTLTPNRIQSNYHSVNDKPPACVGCEANQGLMQQLLVKMELVVQNINYLILINQQRSDQGEMADVDNWQPKKNN
ncbi:hypothetical protein FQR65_LT18390 [Abscondita terminalis]|nr:hypothetical protein FQR65_LT18390 [Abscondita terminalis]